MNISSLLAGIVRGKPLVAVVITGAALLYAGPALTGFLTYRSEIIELLDRVREVLDHPAIRPLA